MNEFLNKIPVSPITSFGNPSVPNGSTFGTNFSILQTGGYTEVYSLSGLTYTIPPVTTGIIEFSGNSIPIQLTIGSGSVFSPNVLTLNSDNISSGRRKLGMLVYVYETNKIYQFRIDNYDTLWNNATGATGPGGSTVVVSDFGTTVKNNSPEGIAFINAWTASTISGIGGYNDTNASWRILSTGGSGGTSITGGTFNHGTETLSLFNSTGGTITITGFTDINVTGGTYSNGTITFKNNTGGTFNVIGLYTGATDVFVTGGTYSSGTTTFTNNTGGTFNVSGYFTGQTDNYITGGTFNKNTETLSLNNSTGGTITITGFTDINVTGATYSNNTFTYINNTGGTFSVLFNTVTGLTVNGNLTVTGNTSLRAFTGTSGVVSGSGQNILTVIGSGSSTTSPIFSVQGSQGELFSVSDSLIGSLFSVNNISGLPVIEAFSDDTILMGSYLAPSLNTTVKLSLTAGTNTIYSIPISAYTGAFVDYTLINSGNTSARAGNIMSIWTTGSTEFTDVSTNDIGSTSSVTFSTVLSGTNTLIRASATTTGWVLKTIIRSI
jgi:hypothetical protein